MNDLRVVKVNCDDSSERDIIYAYKGYVFREYGYRDDDCRIHRFEINVGEFRKKFNSLEDMMKYIDKVDEVEI